MTEPQDRIAQVWNDAVGQHIAGLSQDDYDAMVATFRPQANPAPAPAVDESNLPLARRSSFAEKCGVLADITARCTDGNGYTAGIADAAAARDNPQPPEPQPQPFQQTTGYSVNRAQGAAGGSDWAPIKERDLNTQKIADIRAQRGL